MSSNKSIRKVFSFNYNRTRPEQTITADRELSEQDGPYNADVRVTRRAVASVRSRCTRRTSMPAGPYSQPEPPARRTEMRSDTECASEAANLFGAEFTARLDRHLQHRNYSTVEKRKSRSMNNVAETVARELSDVQNVRRENVVQSHPDLVRELKTRIENNALVHRTQKATAPPKHPSASHEELSGFSNKRDFFENLISSSEESEVLIRRTNSAALRSEPNKSKTCILYTQPEPKPKHITVVKEGPIDRVKLMPSGKKLPKSWKPKYVVLTDQALFFAENGEVLLTMKSGNPGSMDNVDLRGAHLSNSSLRSSKKNVIHITAHTGYEALIQNDNDAIHEAWYTSIMGVVHRLYSSSSQIPRTRSLRDIGDDDIFLSDPVKDPRTTLKRLIHRRPTMESLVDKGIYKDEPIFGNYLDCHHNATKRLVPDFVEKCIAVLEEPEHIASDGLYRTSGNMSHIQSLRLQVDQGNLGILKDQKDTDVLAGGLKLFFRELKAPLIPYPVYKDVLSILLSQKDEEKRLNAVQKEINQRLSPSHLQTLAVLCKHLVKVTKFEKQNKMDMKNLAIVWGPTLTWSDDQNMFQCNDINRVVEYLIRHTSMIFKKR